MVSAAAVVARRIARGSVPYLLLLPVALVLGAILGYPIYSLVRLSLQHYTLFELIRHQGQWIGLDNFTSVLSDQVFWHTALRTVVFTAVNVGLTMVFGTGLALLFTRVSALGAHPAHLGPRPRLGDAAGRRRPDLQLDAEPTERRRELLADPGARRRLLPARLDGLDVLAARRRHRADRLGRAPVRRDHRLRGAVAGAARALEAAEIDGARPWRVFRDVTFPIIQPILLILTSLSILWDFGVFTQAFLLIGQSHIHPGNYLMSIYLFEEGYVKSDFGRGAAISLLMLVMVAAMSVVYVRRMLKVGEVE